MFKDVTNDGERDHVMIMKCLVMLTDTSENQWRIFKTSKYDKLMIMFGEFMCEHFEKLMTVLRK